MTGLPILAPGTDARCPGRHTAPVLNQGSTSTRAPVAAATAFGSALLRLQPGSRSPGTEPPPCQQRGAGLDHQSQQLSVRPRPRQHHRAGRGAFSAMLSRAGVDRIDVEDASAGTHPRLALDEMLDQLRPKRRPRHLAVRSARPRATTPDRPGCAKAAAGRRKRPPGPSHTTDPCIDQRQAPLTRRRAVSPPLHVRPTTAPVKAPTHGSAKPGSA